MSLATIVARPVEPEKKPMTTVRFGTHVAGGLFRSVTYTSTAVSVQNLLASEGNTDGDRDVDTVDLTGMIMNYTGQL